MKRALTLLLFLAATFNFTQGQKVTKPIGSTFNFEGYTLSTQNLYPDIKQEDIKAVRVSFREISKSDPANSILFYPETKEGNNTNLFDLLLWAIREEGLRVYDPDYSDFIDFSKEQSMENLKTKMEWMGENMEGKDNRVLIEKYLLFESTMYGTNDKPIAVRPIGLCPVGKKLRVWDGDGETITDTLNMRLFWVHFPDIMDMLNNHVPASKIKGVKSTLDFYATNQYESEEKSKSFFDCFVPTNELGYVYTNFVHRIDKGVFVNPYNRLFHGKDTTIAQRKKQEYQFSEIDPKKISYSKYVYKTIAIDDVENHPIFYPIIQAFGQKSLFSLMVDGVKNQSISAFSPDYMESSDSTPVDYSDIRMAMDAMDGEVMMQNQDGNDTVITIPGEIRNAEIREYILKELQLFDFSGNIIAKRPVSLTPIRVYAQFFDEEEPEIRKHRVCTIPFGREDNLSFMANSYAQPYSVDDDYSFLSFFVDGLYKTQEERFENVSVKQALNEIGVKGFQYPEPKIEGINPSNLNEQEYQVTYRKVSSTDSIYFQLFNPEYSENGLMSFFHFVTVCIDSSEVKVYAERDGNFGEEFTAYDVRKIFDALNDTIIVIDPIYGDREFEVVRAGEYPWNSVKSFVFKQIIIDGKSNLVGVCPVLEYYDENDYNYENPLYKNTVWIPFSNSFQKALASQEIIREVGDPNITFLDYFQNSPTLGEIVDKKTINREQAEEIIAKINY